MRKVLIAMSCFWLTTATAQSPFLEAMRYVPSETFLAETSNVATFADLRAGYAVRDMHPPASWAAMAPGNERSILSALPYGAARSVVTYLLNGAPLYPELLGLDFFDLNGTLEFGVPPDQALALLGDIQPLRVGLAFMARGYRLEEPLLCPQAGCDTGRQQDIRNREPGNPFGGDFGRNFPVFVRPGVLAGSASDDLARQMVASSAGELDSLADLPAVQALDAVLSGMPHVLTVSVVNPQFIAADPVQLLGPHVDDTAAAAVLAQLAGIPLPAFSLAGFAASADSTYDYGHALLVYPDAQQAAAAARSLDERLASYRSQRTQLSFAETLTARDFELSPVTVVPGGDSGQTVVKVTLKVLLDDTTDAPFPGLAYRRLIDTVYTRDYLWLAPAD